MSSYLRSTPARQLHLEVLETRTVPSALSSDASLVQGLRPLLHAATEAHRAETPRDEHAVNHLAPSHTPAVVPAADRFPVPTDPGEVRGHETTAVPDRGPALTLDDHTEAGEGMHHFLGHAGKEPTYEVVVHHAHLDGPGPRTNLFISRAVENTDPEDAPLPATAVRELANGVPMTANEPAVEGAIDRLLQPGAARAGEAPSLAEATAVTADPPDLPTPARSGLIGELLTLDTAAVDSAVRRFLDGLDATVAGSLHSSTVTSLAPWLSAAVLCAATGELTRRQLRGGRSAPALELAHQRTSGLRHVPLPRVP